MTGSINGYSQRSLAIYVSIFAVGMLVSVPLSLSWREFYALWFLKAAGELQPVESIVTQQQATDALYGSALFEDEFRYKLELIRERKPEIVALGSSRALQFRQEFFSVPFVNAGRAMNSIPEGARFVEEMLRVHRPRLVLLALDVWWLNANRSEPPTSQRDLGDTDPLVSNFWSYVNDGKITMAKTLGVVLGETSNPVSARYSIGIAALARGGGFRPDGSRDYGARYFGIDPTFDDKNFANARSRVHNGTSLLNYGEQIDRGRLATLTRIAARLQEAGVEVVGVLPPLAPTVVGLINEQPQQYAYMPRAREAMRSLPIKVFDFLESQSLQTSDCEFADGLHAGDITYQRMLLSMADAEPSGPLASMLRRTDIAINVQNLAGRAVTPTLADGYRYPEVDFLGIGCHKPPLPQNAAD
jgi:hypothetical protein